MFELYQLRYFIAVVETGSFTKAAGRACVTQPTLSAGIKKLEQHLDTRLFHRTSRRVYLTEAGSRFLERAKAILFECNRAAREMSRVEVVRVLRLGIVRTLPMALFSKLLKDFRREDAGAVIELFDGTEQELVNRLRNGGLDLAITLIRDGTETAHGQPLFTEGYSLALAGSHPLARHSRISGHQLAADNMIIRSRCEVLSESSRYFTDRNVRPRIVYRTESDERALEMIRAGLGVTVMPNSYSAPGVAPGMAMVPLEGFDLQRTIGLVAPPHAPPSETRPLVERFAAFTSSQAWEAAA